MQYSTVQDTFVVRYRTRSIQKPLAIVAGQQQLIFLLALVLSWLFGALFGDVLVRCRVAGKPYDNRNPARKYQAFV